MCGRYTLSSPGELVAELFELETVPALAPRYNIAPTQEAAIVRAPDGRRELVLARWGLVPYWAKEPAMGSRMINARSETVAVRPAFREPFLRRRCLVAADGFFEWGRAPGCGKQPYLLRLRGGRPFAFAGLWDRWVPHHGEPIESFTILTTDANELVASIHDRMPVILPPAHHRRWLGEEEAGPGGLEALLTATAAVEMEVYPVSTAVNQPANDRPECVLPLPDWRQGDGIRL